MKNDCPDGADEKKGLEGKPCGEKVVLDYGIFKHLNYFKTYFLEGSDKICFFVLLWMIFYINYNYNYLLSRFGTQFRNFTYQLCQYLD